MEQVTSEPLGEPLGEPRGEPVAYYFRDLLLIGGEATRLYLVRHAQSEGNRGEYEGPDNDPPLSAVGLEQAGRLAPRVARQRPPHRRGSPGRPAARLRGHLVGGGLQTPASRRLKAPTYVPDGLPPGF